MALNDEVTPEARIVGKLYSRGRIAAMAIIPGRYGGYGVRLPRPGSASRMVDPIPVG